MFRKNLIKYPEAAFPKRPTGIEGLDEITPGGLPGGRSKICEEHLAGKYRIEVIDLLENPQLARGDQILAILTLVRKLPPPLKKIIGDFSNTERVLIGLDLRPLNIS